MVEQLAIRLFVIEGDIYARQAIVSYLSWDRRTRVVGKAASPHEMIAAMREDPSLTRLDAVILDSGLAADSQGLAALVRLILNHVPKAAVICLAHVADADMALAAGQAGAAAYLLREEVGVGLAGAVNFVVDCRYVVSQSVACLLEHADLGSLQIVTLPERRQYPRLTQRIEEALWLCVIEGLPAELAAEAMGVSTNTVRSYVKEGYRILEACDDTVYPANMSPAERAFLRFSALNMPETSDDDHWMLPAA